MFAALENLFKRMSLKQDLFSQNEYDMMKTIFTNLHLTKENKKKLLEEMEKMQTKEETLKKGLRKPKLQQMNQSRLKK